MNYTFFQSLRNYFKKYWVFYLVILFSFVIRIFQLTQYPPILNRDEAALAYNAKLIVESGKDEWGKPFPLQFKSFGDYKLPGYIYTLSTFFKIFDTNDFVVRLPSTMAGVGIVIVGSMLIAELFHFEKNDLNTLLSQIFLSVTPVFFFYSRMAWEANVALFLLLSSLFVFMKNKDGKLINDVLSGVLLLLATLTYNTPFLLLPFFLPLLIIYRGTKQVKKWIFPVFLWSSILMIGALLLLSIATQKSGITIFTDETVTIEYPLFRQQVWPSLQGVLGNHYIYWFTIISRNYVATFSPNFLVIHGGSHPWHSILGRGHIYWFEYIGFFIGFVMVIKQSIMSVLKKNWRTFIFSMTPIYLLLISPLPAVITVDAPHATRSLFTFFMIIGFSIYGIVHMFSFAFVKEYSKLFIIGIISIACLEALMYGYQYFNLWPRNYSAQLNISFDNAVQQAQNNFPYQKKVVIDDEGYLYVLTAWYADIDSNTFFNTVKKHLPDEIGLQYGYGVGEYRFVKSIDDRIEGENVVLLKNDDQWKVEIVQ